MKKTFLFLIILFYHIANAQTNIVTINAHLEGLQPGKWVYYRKQTADGKRDSIKAMKDGFILKIKIPQGKGSVYSIRIEGDVDNPNLTTYVYLDNGSVFINSNDSSFKNANLTGAKSIIDYNNHNKIIAAYMTSKYADSIYYIMDELRKKNDYDSIDIQRDKLFSGLHLLNLRWVQLHRLSPISAYVLNDLRSLSLDTLKREFSLISPTAKNNVAGKELADYIKVKSDKLKLPDVGKIATNFTQPDTLGKPVSLKQFRGKYVLLDFWASWCEPCRAENPNVAAAFNKYKDKNFTVFSVSLDRPGDKAQWLEAIHKDGMPWTNVSDLKGFNNNAAKQYAIESIPANFLLDKKGKIIAKDLRGEDLENKLAEVLQ